MTKIYKLLIDSPEYPKGTQARTDKDGGYSIYTFGYKMPNRVHNQQIEQNPCWELQEEKLDLRSPEAEKMREESRATRFDFIPRKGEMVFLYGLNISRCERVMYDEAYMHEWSNGFIKRTRELGQLHGEKYSRYFLTE